MITKKYKGALLFILTLFIICFILQSSLSITEKEASFQYIDSIDYSESLDTLTNPERGFYNPVGYNLKQEGNQAINPKGNLIHLRIGIATFSRKHNNQEDIEITEDALNAIKKTFENIRNNNSSVIIRFSYDNFYGQPNKEPAIEMILKHLEQLGKILIEYEDVISTIEMGFLGLWGELHGSTISNYENISLITTKLLNETNQKIKISLRTPGHYAAWKKIDRGALNLDISTKGTMDYQVGIYNDGYLGSESDLGTFSNRNIEVAWLSNHAKHTFYGGEISANYASGTPLNTIEYLSTEAFQTHTTYLNISWNNLVIDSFKNVPYMGENPFYKNETAYKYIENHLGYRFVLKSSYLTTKIKKTDPLKLKLRIENVGFSNLIKEKLVSIVLENENEIYEIQTSLNATDWESTKTTEENFSITLPNEIKEGEYKVYIRLSEYANLKNDHNYHCIKFANKEIYNNNLGANYVGTINIIEEKEEPTSTATPTPTSTATPTPTATNSNIIDDLKQYKIEYYYDNILSKKDTIISKAEKNSIIRSYIDKEKENYVLTETVNYPLTISDNEEKNIIKIYYTKREKQESTQSPKEINYFTLVALISDILLGIIVFILLKKYLKIK